LSWIAVEMILEATEADILTQSLLEAGAESIDVADAAAGTVQERPMFDEPGQCGPDPWERNRLTALFPANVDYEAALKAAANLAGRGLPHYRVARVDDRDWVRLTQSQFAPIRVSARLWIVPTWHQAPDPGAVNIVLDPGLAFGTGSHPTTRLCLRWLAGRLEHGQSVIDYGCGSGILAIAAAKLGARKVTGVDIDAQALEASRYNARLNKVAVQFLCADAAAPGPADVVVANILSGPLKALAPLLAKLVRGAGLLVMSGVLATQADEVSMAYAPWFEMRVGEADEEWVRLEGVRRQEEAGST
jgi:ribosomal protein L11 methyltransferase